jgi:hypothetical protein
MPRAAARYDGRNRRAERWGRVLLSIQQSALSIQEKPEFSLNAEC